MAHACAAAIVMATLGALSGATAAPTARAAAAPSPDRQRFYRQALPTAQSFVRRRIDAARLMPTDQLNDVYWQALGPKGETVGYLRDFVGAVSANQACPCNPINLTLAFDSQLRLVTLLAPAPLQKWGHEAMSEAEFARLIALMQQLPEALCAVPTVEDMVDATTGATRTPLNDVVVAHAALSTRRIAGLVADTRAILQNSPLEAAQGRLHALLQQRLSPSQRAARLAALLPQLFDQSLRLQAYHLMVQAYLEALKGGRGIDAKVEESLLGFAVLCEGGGKEVAEACIKVAESGRRPAFVARCAEQLGAANARGVPPQTPELLLGTMRFLSGKKQAAVPLLIRAAESRSVRGAPQLYGRLAQAQRAVGDLAGSCATAKQLLLVHPRFGDRAQLLQGCAAPGAEMQALADELLRTQRNSFLQTDVEVRGAPKRATLKDSAGRSVEVDYVQASKITVLVFFSAWCPYCQAELPHLRAFADSVSKQPQLAERVRIVAVRTAQEKDNAAAQQFWRQFRPNFPVYDDFEMSREFARFARSTGRPTMLPTTAVLDPAGTIRFFLEPGLYRDTAAELRWAVESLVPPSPNP